MSTLLLPAQLNEESELKGFPINSKHYFNEEVPVFDNPMPNTLLTTLV